jgi:hypothetical protein
MPLQVKEREGTAETLARPTVPRSRPHVRTLAIALAVLVGVTAGGVAYRMVSAQREAARMANVQEIQAHRWVAIVKYYGRSWDAHAAERTPARIAVTGTGPGLGWLADRQAAWAERAVTGTGPGLVTIALLQEGCSRFEEPTGTGGGLTHLCAPPRPEVVLISIP